MSDLSFEDVAILETVEMKAWESMFAAAPEDLRQGLGLETRWFGPAMATMSRVIDIGQFNRIQGIGLPGDEDGDCLEPAVDWFREAGLKNFLVQPPPGPRSADFAERIETLELTPFRRGWTKFRRPPLPAMPPPTDLIILEATADRAADFGETAAAGFDMPPSLARWLGALVGRPGWRCYLACEGERPLGCGAAFIDGGEAWLGIGATRPEGRGRGSQSAILARRINDAIAAGVSMLSTETGSAVPGEPQTSFSNILRAGFEIAYERPNWTGP
jgi:GNAT superfamily N-acetyltransferase